MEPSPALSAENQDWESFYARGEMPWDKSAPSPALLEAVRRQPLTGRVVVPGCGLGHDVRALAATGVAVVGLDISPTAVKAAQALTPVGGELYRVGDLFAPEADLVESFDALWEHTCFCAIPPQRRTEYVASCARLLKPGGVFLGVFYLDPGQDRPTQGPPFETTVAELDALFAPHFTLEAQWAPSRNYPGREYREWVRRLRRRE